MANYEKGEIVSTTGTNNAVITWVATGDEQRDAAIEIQITQAVECLGWKYGTSDYETTLDCSGLTRHLYSFVDVELSTIANVQHTNYGGEEIYNKNMQFNIDDLQTGDILSFNGHVAYYLGNGYFIHSVENHGVVIGSLSSKHNYYEKYDDYGTGMEVTGTGNHWLNELKYVTRFEDNIYVDDNGTVYHVEKKGEKKYKPIGKYGDDIMYQLMPEKDEEAVTGIFDKDRGFISIEDKEKNEKLKLSIINSIMGYDMPDGIKEAIIGRTISEVCGETIDKEEYERLIDIYESNKVVESQKTINEVVTHSKANVTTARITRYDPLIFDLDGDGYNVEKKELGANFDLDKNGFAEKINWTKKDGFLCLDLNGNGTIDDGGELFGDQTLLADGTKAKNGFEALAQYDSNGDGVIDANDEIFDSLHVWVDADGDGISGEGEMKTLAELGITLINLGYENVNAETGTEATIGNTATFTREDGTTSGIGELWVSSDLFDTVDRLDIEISGEIAALPDVKSIGNVYSLRNAMALDETGELKALVESFISEEDTDKRIAITEQILFFISGAKNIAANSRGAYIDARQLAVIEAMLGEKYVGTSGANPHSDAAPMLKSAYQDLLNMYFSELNAQTFIKDYAALLRYTENEDGTKTLNADLVNYILEYQLENGDENAEKMLTEVARFIQYLDNGGIKGINSQMWVKSVS